MLQNALPAFGLLVLMVLVAWRSSRSRHQIAGLAGHGEPSLRVMNSLASVRSGAVVTVQVGQGAEGVCLVLGVTAGSITALHQLPCPAAPRKHPPRPPLPHRASPACWPRSAIPMHRAERLRHFAGLGLGLAALAGLLLAADPVLAQVAAPVAPAPLPTPVPAARPVRRAAADGGRGPGGTSYSVPVQTLLFFTALSFLPAVLLLMTVHPHRHRALAAAPGPGHAVGALTRWWSACRCSSPCS